MASGDGFFGAVRQNQNEPKIMKQFLHLQQVIELLSLVGDKNQHIAAVHVIIQEDTGGEMIWEGNNSPCVEDAVDYFEQLPCIVGIAGSIDVYVHRCSEYHVE